MATGDVFALIDDTETGIRHMQGKRRVTWHRYAFERDEIVEANGGLAESLLLGEMVVAGSITARV